MSLPILPDSTRDAYLRRLEIETPSLDLNGLTVLQGAHLRRVPFHNLGLLINDGKPYRVPSLVEVAQANARGIGGTCHLTTPGFATLLRTLGFEVDLIGGAVNHPGDHLLALVHLPQGDYVVDVGNGHPYLSPFPLGHQLSWQAYGWQFFWDGNTLRRRLPDGSIRQVYTVEPTPRAWESFAEAIRAHHEQPGFGPFLASLRAVTLTDDIMLTVRDVELTRYGPLGASRRPLQSAAAARRVLADCLHLEASSVDSALAILEQRRPGMFRGTPAAPRILVAVPTIAREAQLQRLLDSLERDRVRSGLGNDEVEVVILDNVAADPDEKPISFGNFPFKLTRYAITNVCLAREQGLGLLPVERPPMSIGAARHALINIVARTLVDRDENWIVWMLDDDLQFAQLIRDQEGVHEHASIPLLAQARRLWAEHPDISIGLGTFCGDPPIPGFATWLGQLRDLQVTLEAMVDFQPDTAWPQSTVDGSLTEHYYDHAGDKLDTGPSHIYEGSPGATVGQTFAKLAHAWPAIIRGSHVTRPLVLPRPTPPGRSIARGGNVLILDRNALLAAPFPVHRGEDGVVTRRADTLAAVLVDDTVWQCRVFDLPLLHGRLLADGSSPMSNRKRDGFNLAAFVEAQARGVAMVRATHHGTPKSVDTHLDRRRQLHQTGFDAIRETLKKVRTLLQNPNSWWWSVAYEHHVRDILAGLNELAASIPSTADLDAVSTDISEDLAHFCGALKAKTRQWRRTWV